MSERLFLHIGAFKTGTSYLQGVLAANARQLRAAGVLVAPRRSAAVHDVVNFKRRGKAHLRSVRGSWAGLVDTARAFEGRATVLSHEYLSLQGPERADKIVASLQGLETHVVLTVRDAAGVLPAQWQTLARNRGGQSWPEYVAAARDERTHRRSHTFLHAQRIGTLLRLWRTRVGLENLHVVTVPPPSAPRHVLWDRFAGVIGVDPAVATVLDVPSNPSTGYATGHLLCLVHAEVARRRLERKPVQQMAVFVGHRAASRRAEEPSPPLDEETIEFADAWNREVRRVILRSRVEVTGDLAELVPKPDLSRARPLLPPADPDVLAAAYGVADSLDLLGPGRRPRAWSTVDDAVTGIADLMAAVIDCGGVERLSPRGTALRQVSSSSATRRILPAETGRPGASCPPDPPESA